MTGYLPDGETPDLPQAACKQIPTEWFYASDCVNPDKKVVDLARQVCMFCVERKPCLEYALTSENYGMWGGFTSNERKDLKKHRLHKLKHLVELGLLLEE